MTELLGGKYEVLELAGEGGMAKVYRGQTHGAAGFTRPVAIKRVLAPLSQNPEFLKMFVEEARVVSELDHPNIAQIHDFDRDRAGEYYLVLEWVDGLTLSEWRQGYEAHGHHVPWNLTAAIGIEVLEALHAAHERKDAEGKLAPIFHRDVTPQNVMVSNCGVVKLTDFGLARAMDRSSITSPGFVKGKLSYLAPELTYEAEPSAQTDVFSTGVVLWEVLAGEKLIKDKDPLKVVGTIRDMEIPDLTEFRGDVPTPLQEIIRKALRRSLEQRDGARPRRPPTRDRGSHRLPRDRPKRALGSRSTRPVTTQRPRNETNRGTRGPAKGQLRRRNHPRHQHPPNPP
ncbi:MAG: serine/threonine protein kinase [Deltaproteobacteria bacterium]|nr:MAG: serine/threonine protein kinase [Deltaproteobacteria bacterium]